MTADYATRYEVELSPLPAFRDLSPEAYREKVTELVCRPEPSYVPPS